MTRHPKTLIDLPSNRHSLLFPLLCLVAAVAFRGFEYVYHVMPQGFVEFPVDRTILCLYYILLGGTYLAWPRARGWLSYILLVSVYIVPVWFLARPVLANEYAVEYLLGYFAIVVGIQYFVESPWHVAGFGLVQILSWFIASVVGPGSPGPGKLYLMTGVIFLMSTLTFVFRESARRLRSRLVSERRFFQALFRSSPDAQIITERGKVVDHNPRFLRYFELSADIECRGRSLSELLADRVLESDRSRFSALLRYVHEEGIERRVPFQTDLGFRSRDGIAYFGNVVATVIDFESDGYLLTIRDITARHRALEQLEDAKKRAETAAAVKARFLSTMSHEIRTPLGGVIGLSRLLREDDFPPERKDDLLTLEATAQTLLTLINDILDLSKLEAGKAVLQSDVVAPAELVDTVIRTFSMEAEKKGLDLRSVVEVPAQLRVILDRARLLQILLNLVGNAVKFTAEGSVTVTVELKACDGQVCELVFSVADTGAGIPGAEIDRIFDEFYQASVSGSGGTGLGLAIVRRTLELYGSTIDVDSTLGTGSTFRFVLRPRAAEGSQDDRELRVNHTALLGRVVIVEDDRVNRLVLERTLERWGLEVSAYDSAESALEAVRTMRPEVLMVDMQLPGIDGVEFARRVRAASGDETRRQRIILLSASLDQEVVAAASDAGIDECVSKPFDPDDLYGRLARHVSAR